MQCCLNKHLYLTTDDANGALKLKDVLALCEANRLRQTDNEKT